jgi:hypothetical protein
MRRSYEGVACFLPGYAEHLNSWGRSKFTQLWLWYLASKYGALGIAEPTFSSASLAKII